MQKQIKYNITPHNHIYIPKYFSLINLLAVSVCNVPKVARSRLHECTKSCDLQPALHSAIRLAQGVLPCVEWGCDQSIGSTVSDAIVRS